MGKQKRLFAVFLMLALVVPYVLQLAAFFPLKAEAVTETAVQLVNNQRLAVAVTQENTTDRQNHWRVTYDKKQIEAADSSRLKVKLGAGGVVTAANGWQQIDDWWVEPDFSPQSQGQLEMTTDGQTPLEITLQLATQTRALGRSTKTSQDQIDGEKQSENSEILTDNSLTPAESGPHRIEPRQQATTTAATSTSNSEEGLETSATATSPHASEEVTATTVSPAKTTTTSEAATATTLPVATDEETATSIEPVAPTTESEVSTVPTTESTNESTTESSSPVTAPTISGPRAVNNFPTAVPQNLAALAGDFSYEDDGTGTYPTNYTEEYLSGNQSGGVHQHIRNYHYGKSDASGVQLFNVTETGSLNFVNGYHEYGTPVAGQTTFGRINLKKTVAPIPGSPDQFKVQLDTIGDAIKPIKQVDVVIVIDKSGSMAGANWDSLKSAVSQFATDMFTPGRDVRIGIAGFSGYQDSDDNWRTKAEIASFAAIPSFSGNNLPASLTGFVGTSNGGVNALMNHAIFNEAPTGGTPTFLGVDAGLKLLTTPSYGARAGVAKVLVTITDGVPTYYPTATYADSKTLDQSLALTTKSRTNSDRILRLTTASQLYEGNGNSDYSSQTLPFITQRQNEFSTPFWYGVGFHTGTAANVVVDALGRAASYRANDISSLVNALNTSVAELVNTISVGTITDPMSEYVTFNPGSLQTYSFSVKNNALSPPVLVSTTTGAQYARNVAIATNGSGLTATNVSLGIDGNGRQGLRITYRVTLKAAYQNGKFYPTNGGTTLDSSSTGKLNYAVPSVRHLKLVNLTLTKVDSAGAKLAGAQFRLVGEQTYTGTVANAQGQMQFTGVIPGDYLLEEISPLGPFKAFEPLAVTVNPDGSVQGLTNNQVVNRLKAVTLTLKKTDEAGEALTGAVFQLKKGDETFTLTEGADGTHQVTELAPGVYQLVESKAPPGFIPRGQLGTVTIGANGNIQWLLEGRQRELSVDTTGEQLTVNLGNIVNQRKPIDLTLAKVDGSGKALVGATFQLQREGLPSITLTEANDASGQHQATDLAPGTYRLVETDAPTGFAPLGEIGTLVIAADASVTFQKGEVTQTITVDTTAERVTVHLGKIKNQLLPVALTLHKKTGTLPLAGAVFQLLQAGEVRYTFTETAAVPGRHQLSGVLPGSYVLKESTSPTGYQALGELGTVTIGADGQVKFVMAGQDQEVSVTATDHQLQVDLGTITNQLKPFELSIRKQATADKQGLPGASFSLFLPGEDQVLATATSDAAGLAPFMSVADPNQPYPLTPGSYVIKETTAPTGYQRLQGEFLLVIAENGTATVSYAGKAAEEVRVTLTTGEDPNQLQFTVTNDPANPLPKTGGFGSLSYVILATFLIGASSWYFVTQRQGKEGEQ